MAGIIRLCLVFVVLLGVWACGESQPFLDCGDTHEFSGWAKVNTHVHTTLSDGTQLPEYVMQWYKSNCYDAISITDHNIQSEAEAEGIIVIPGNEESRPRHYTSLNHGEIDILAHPNMNYHFTLDELIALTDVKFFEVYNAHPMANNEGNAEYPSTEVIWNEILRSGRSIYGVASDDAHFKNGSWPGMAWVMIRVDELTQADILAAMQAGDFYSSTGVYLSEYQASDDYIMEVDYHKTGTESCEFELIAAGDFRRGKVTCIKPNGSEVFAWGQPYKKERE